MIKDDDLLGTKRADMTEIKEIKVKLPLRQLLQLHYAKLTSQKSISEVVGQALVLYFEELHGPRPPEAATDAT